MKYYMREGSRFKQVESLYGMYANTDGTFTPKRVGNSYGVVVIHNFKEIVIAHLKVIPDVVWCVAVKKYNLPTRLQLLAAYNLNHMFHQTNCEFWTSENHDIFTAWAVRSDSYTYVLNKYCECYVREFTTIKLLYMIKFLYFAAAILAFIASFKDSEQSLLYIILGCICAVLFKLQIIEEEL